MFLGGYVEHYADPEAIREPLAILGFADAQALRRYLKDLLGTVPVSAEVLRAAAENLMADPGKLKNYPFPITADQMVAMAN